MNVDVTLSEVRPDALVIRLHAVDVPAFADVQMTRDGSPNTPEGAGVVNGSLSGKTTAGLRANAEIMRASAEVIEMFAAIPDDFDVARSAIMRLDAVGALTLRSLLALPEILRYAVGVS